MHWALTFGSVKGTKLRMHFTFLLFLLWIGLSYYAQGGASAAAGGLTFVLLLFLCVVLHEFGHILAARHFRVGTSEILLLPIGGIARLDRIPERPREELLIALAGPMVTLAIAVVLIVALGGLPDPSQILAAPTGPSIAAQLVYANLALLVFNLVPAFPLDGGRVLRALLSAWLGHLRGTRVAAAIGRGTAVLLGLVGLMAGNLMLVLIAAFIYIAAGAEAGLSRIRASLAGIPARDVMITAFETMAPDAPVSDAAEALIRTGRREFPIVDDEGRFLGLVTHDGIVRSLGDVRTPLDRVMRTDIPQISQWHRLDDSLRLLEAGMPAIAVTGSDGRLVGLITWNVLLDQLLLRRRASHAAALASQAIAPGHPYLFR